MNTLSFSGNIILYFVRQIGIQNIRILDNFTFLDPWLSRWVGSRLGGLITGQSALRNNL